MTGQQLINWIAGLGSNGLKAEIIILDPQGRELALSNDGELTDDFLGEDQPKFYITAVERRAK